MSSIEKRERDGQVRHYARYRDPSGKQLVKAFERRRDAVNFLTSIESAKLRGVYVDPHDTARPFREFAMQHFAAHEHALAADTTRPRKRSILERHILPSLGDYPIGSIKPSTVAGAVAIWSKTLAPGSVGQVLRQVRQILDAAMADGLIVANSAKAVKAPAAPRRRDVHLTDEDVTKLVSAAPLEYRGLVIALAGLGLRISEACGLRVTDVDFLRQTIHVRQQRRPCGDMGQLNTGSSSRDIPAVDVVLAALAEQIRNYPRTDGLVFSRASKGPLSKSNEGHVFDRLEATAGVKVSPHSPRHYFGASLISPGVSVVAVSQWLGHSSPEITWRVYSYLMPSDQEVGRAAMAKTMAKVVPFVYPLCTADGAPSA